MSKKDIGERRIRINIVLCSKEAAFNVKTCLCVFVLFLKKIVFPCIFKIMNIVLSSNKE